MVGTAVKQLGRAHIDVQDRTELQSQHTVEEHTNTAHRQVRDDDNVCSQLE